MTPEELVSKAAKVHRHTVTIRRSDAMKQIVEGEVYAPFIIDSHGDMMDEQGVELLAHRFLEGMKNDQIDVMHNNKVIKATVVESFIAREGDPVYNKGAWVLATKIVEDEVWEQVMAGEFSGYSFEAMVVPVEMVAEVSVLKQTFGHTEKAVDHEHAFFVKLSNTGRVLGGTTSKAADGHYHEIRFGTATETTDEHSHRYFLP